MNAITNKDIIKFYSRKVMENEDIFQKTYYFENEHRQRSGGYISLARTFLSDGVSGKDDKEKRFYKWLRAKEEEHTIYQLRAFRYLEEDTKFDIFLNHARLNQKWHCLVSWYAYTEFDGRLNDITYTEPIYMPDAQKTCILKPGNRCPELRLWLVEAAADEKNISDSDVERFMNEALTYVECRNRKKWNEVWVEYRQKIERAIVLANDTTCCQ